MSDELLEEVNKNLGIEEANIADPLRENELDFLRRQIILCQDAADMQMFIGKVEMLEAMLQEDIEKNKMPYDPHGMELNIRKAAGILPAKALDLGTSYNIALEKFKVLYRIFKETHMPVSAEGRL